LYNNTKSKEINITLEQKIDVSKSTLLPESNSPKYRVCGIILDVAHHRLYKLVLTNTYTQEKRKFLNLHFANKGLDAINIAINRCR